MNAETLKGLKEEAVEIEETLKALRTLINRYDSSYTSLISKTEPIINSGYTLPSGKVEDQILHFMEHFLQNPQKMTDIEKSFNKLRGKPLNTVISNTIRDLRDEGKVISAIYNNSNRQVFWGLPQWVNDTDYRPEYRPKEVPIDAKVQIGKANKEKGVVSSNPQNE